MALCYSKDGTNEFSRKVKNLLSHDGKQVFAFCAIAKRTLRGLALLRRARIDSGLPQLGQLRICIFFFLQGLLQQLNSFSEAELLGEGD